LICEKTIFWKEQFNICDLPKAFPLDVMVEKVDNVQKSQNFGGGEYGW